MRPPWGVAESGFNDANSLIWIMIFGTYHYYQWDHQVTPGLKQFEILIRSEVLIHFSFRKAHYELFYYSVRMLTRSFEDKAVKRYSCSYRLAYLMCMWRSTWIQSNASIYINCPAPISSLVKSKYSGSSKIAELFRFAALMAETPGLSAYFSQNCRMVNYRSFENEEMEPRKWLDRQWIQRSEIGFREKGSLSSNASMR